MKNSKKKTYEEAEAFLCTKGWKVSDFVFFEKVSGFGSESGTFVALTQSELLVLKGESKLVFKGKNVFSKFVEESYQAFSIDKISKAKLETTFLTASITAYIDENACLLVKCEISQTAKLGFVCGFLEAKSKNLPLPVFSDAHLFCPKCGAKFMEGRKDICPLCEKNKGGFLRLLSFAKEFKWQCAVSFLIALINSAFTIFVPYIGVTYFVDEVLTLGGSRFGEVLTVGLFILGVKLFQVLIDNFFLFINSILVPHMMFAVKQKLFVAIQKQPLKFFSENATGKIMNRISGDADAIYWFLLDGIVYNASSAINIVGILVVMFLISWQLALLALVFVPIIIFVARIFVKMQKRSSDSLYLVGTRLSSKLSNVLGGQRVIKANAKEDDEIASFSRINLLFRKTNLKAANIGYLNYTFISILVDILPHLIWSYGFYLVSSGLSTIATILLIVSYLDILIDPILFIASETEWLGQALSAASRVFTVIDARPDLVEKESPVILPCVNGELDIQNVWFEYEKGRPVLKDFCLKIESGQMIGVVGKSGAGKSTLANLISRLYDVTTGKICIDGVDVRDMSFEQLHKNVGMVSQDIFIFEGTIMDNIRYARPSATYEEVVRASVLADAHEFIVKMDNGYDTFIGGNAFSLSGGQRQRLSIARTIIQNPKILILDEATSAMDTKTEQNIQRSIERLGKNCTSIVIAHRLSTLRRANKIIVIEKGKLIEQGTHEELMQIENGQYARLVAIQNEAMKAL